MVNRRFWASIGVCRLYVIYVSSFESTFDHILIYVAKSAGVFIIGVLSTNRRCDIGGSDPGKVF
jgi:hypothetical protein